MIQDVTKFYKIQAEMASKNARYIARNIEAMTAALGAIGQHMNLLGGKLFELEERVKELEDKSS